LTSPFEALRETFLLWHPQTDASLDQRFEVLDGLRRQHPNVAWRLLLAIVPSGHDVAIPFSAPEWRPWGQNRPSVTRAELSAGIEATVDRLLDDIGSDTTRWATLLSRVDDFPRSEFDSVVARLPQLDAQDMQDHEREELWAALRKVLSHHLEFPDADWSLPPDALRPLAEAYERFAPTDSSRRVAWLFRINPDLPVLSRGGWREREEQIRGAQDAAVVDLFSEGGIDTVLALIPAVESGWSLGHALGRVTLDIDWPPLLSATLQSTDAHTRDFARAATWGRKAREGEEWIHELLRDSLAVSWAPEVRAELLSALSFGTRTWSAIAQEDSATREAYWRIVPIYGRGPLESQEVDAVLDGLMQARRFIEAIDFAAIYRDRISTTHVVRLLESAMADPPDDASAWSKIAYDVAELLRIAESDEEATEDALARLEWFFLPFLVAQSTEQGPAILHRRLARDPAFFATVLSFVYKPDRTEDSPPDDEEDEEETSQEVRTRARLAFELLRTWRTVPGSDAQGIPHEQFLLEWIEEARALAAEARRGAIADIQIGQVLVHAPEGADGIWPHEAVRAALERLSNRDVERGFTIEAFNSRGVYSRSLYEGGEQERQLASRFRAQVDALGAQWPRTKRVLRTIADNYEADARREDVRNEALHWDT
jgi:hypothetical protein